MAYKIGLDHGRVRRDNKTVVSAMMNLYSSRLKLEEAMGKPGMEQAPRSLRRASEKLIDNLEAMAPDHKFHSLKKTKERQEEDKKWDRLLGMTPAKDEIDGTRVLLDTMGAFAIRNMIEKQAYRNVEKVSESLDEATEETPAKSEGTVSKMLTALGAGVSIVGSATAVYLRLRHGVTIDANNPLMDMSLSASVLGGISAYLTGRSLTRATSQPVRPLDAQSEEVKDLRKALADVKHQLEVLEACIQLAEDNVSRMPHLKLVGQN